MDTTVKLSSEGQVLLPEHLRKEDKLMTSDIFRLQRLKKGKYLLEKVHSRSLPKPRLVRSKRGFLVFRSPKGAPVLTDELVKRLEAESA
jgi:hypothetical protein